MRDSTACVGPAFASGSASSRLPQRSGSSGSPPEAEAGIAGAQPVRSMSATRLKCHAGAIHGDNARFLRLGSVPILTKHRGATARERGQALDSPHSQARDARTRFRPQGRACSHRNPLASNDFAEDAAAGSLPHLSRDRWRGARHPARSCHSRLTTLGWFSHGLCATPPNGPAKSRQPTCLLHASNCRAGVENIVSFC